MSCPVIIDINNLSKNINSIGWPSTFVTQSLHEKQEGQILQQLKKNMYSCSLWVELDYLETEVVSP